MSSTHDPVWLRKAAKMLKRRGEVVVIANAGKIDVRSRLDVVQPDHELVGYYRHGASTSQLVEDVEAYRREERRYRQVHRVERR